jgi:hypothetical protein
MGLFHFLELVKYKLFIYLWTFRITDYRIIKHIGDYFHDHGHRGKRHDYNGPAFIHPIHHWKLVGMFSFVDILRFNLIGVTYGCLSATGRFFP